MNCIGMKWGLRDESEEFKKMRKERREVLRKMAEESTRKYEEEQRRLEEQREREMKEGLALVMLLRANGNEENMNNTCDLIKELGLVEDYQ